MSFLTLTVLLFSAAAMMLLGTRLFLKGSSHLRIPLLPSGRKDGSLFSRGALLGLLCPGEAEKEFLWLEGTALFSPYSCCSGMIGACLPLWLPLCTLLPLPCGLLLFFAGLVLLRLPLRGDLSVHLGRILAGLGCFAVGAGLFSRFGGIIAGALDPFPLSAPGLLLSFLLGACISFLCGTPAVPCALAALLVPLYLFPARAVALLFAGIFTGAAFSLPVFSSDPGPWKKLTARIHIAHHMLAALLFALLTLPSAGSLLYFLTDKPFLSAFLPLLFSAFSSLILLAVLHLTKGGLQNGADGSETELSLPGTLPGPELSLLNDALARTGQQVRACVARRMEPSLEEGAQLPETDTQEITGACRSLSFSASVLLARCPSPGEARLCSLFQQFSVLFRQIAESCAELQGGSEPAPLKGALPARGRHALLLAVLDLLDQSVCAVNELCLGHPFAPDAREKGQALLEELRSIQAEQPESARDALSLERVLLGILGLAACAEDVSLQLRAKEPDRSFQ